MSIFHHWPWTNFHELNLDWLLSEVKKNTEHVDKAVETVDKAVDDVENLSQGLANQIISIIEQMTPSPVTLPWVTPQMFGAVGDATTDDSAAFSAMFAADKPVFIPNGHYRLANDVHVDNSVDIWGESQNGVFLFLDPDKQLSINQWRTTLRNMTIVSTGTNRFLINCIAPHCLFEDLYIICGRGISTSPGAVLCTFRNILFEAFDIAILQNSGDCTNLFERVVVRGTGGNTNAIGIGITDSFAVTLRDCSFLLCKQGLTANRSKSIVIDGCFFDQATEFGANFDTCSRITVKNSWFDNPVGIYLTDSNNADIGGCVFRNGNPAISPTTSYSVVVHDNEALQCRIFYSQRAGSGVTVVNNQINTGEGDDVDEVERISFNDPMTNVYCVGNTADRSPVVWYDPANATNFIVKDNLPPDPVSEEPDDPTEDPLDGQ